jgi:hypothetical protein
MTDEKTEKEKQDREKQDVVRGYYKSEKKYEPKSDDKKQEKKPEVHDPLVERIREISGIKKEEKLKEAEKAIDEDRHKILAMSEIGLWIDNYDDIFSDFDPRPYSLRSLSDDFLNEARKASRDKGTGKLELRILIDEKMRNLREEANIKKRLKDHFMKHADLLKKELKKDLTRALLMGVFGILLIFIATIMPEETYVQKLLFVLLEPTGWFMTWFALDNIFYSNRQKKEESGFYHKMSRCEIIFSSY